MDTVSFVLGVVGVAIAVPGLLGLTVSIRRGYRWKLVLKGIETIVRTMSMTGWWPDVVIGLGDGAVPAAILVLNCRIRKSYFIDAPTSGRNSPHAAPANLSLEGVPANFGPQERILILDNHVFSGANLRAACEVVIARGASAANVKTAVLLVHNYPSRPWRPDFYAMQIKSGSTRIPWSFTDEHTAVYLAARPR
jgi:hypoxanthine phosphoribosyltransferase